MSHVLKLTLTKALTMSSVAQHPLWVGFGINPHLPILAAGSRLEVGLPMWLPESPLKLTAFPVSRKSPRMCFPWVIILPIFSLLSSLHHILSSPLGLSTTGKSERYQS